MMRETSEKENQNVYTRKEKEKERRRRRVNSAAAAGCVFCLSYPIFLIGNWPFFLPFCSSTVLRVSVTFNASASCVYRRVCGCTRHSFFILRRTKRKHKFQFWIHNVFSMLEEIVSWLLPSSGYFFFFFGPPVHPSPPESCNGAAAIAAVVSACLLPYNRSPLLFLLDMKLQRARLSDDTDMPVVQYKKGK